MAAEANFSSLIIANMPTDSPMSNPQVTCAYGKRVSLLPQSGRHQVALPEHHDSTHPGSSGPRIGRTYAGPPPEVEGLAATKDLFGSRIVSDQFLLKKCAKASASLVKKTSEDTEARPFLRSELLDDLFLTACSATCWTGGRNAP